MRPAALAALLLALANQLSAQQTKPGAPPASRSHRDSGGSETTTALPVTRVSLYKNGVGFFEHTGHVSGDAAVTIDFTDSQLNDVLQSLTAIDLNGGRIAGAEYNSTTPLDQQLQNLPLALGQDPSATDLFQAIRGARVEVRSGTASITGRLMSVEVRSTPVKEGEPGPVSERRFLTVVSESGEIRTLELTPATSVHLLDSALHTDVNHYLQLIDATRNRGLRHLTLSDRGTGSRELRVSYISEVPIWKSTYRILFTGSNTTTPTATLQGWSVVDNTTGTDWDHVQLSLIAGAPQSFIQPLSQPIYSRRPEIPIAQEAQLTPQTFDSSMDSKAISADQVEALPTYGRAVKALAGTPGGGYGPRAAAVMLGNSAPLAAPAPPPSYEESASASITPSTKTAAFDDYFRYTLTEPVTLHKNESALVPILQAKVPAERVTLVSSNGFTTSQPLRALWITNSSGLTLDRGSFSIVEDGNFGGEGLLDPIHPDEKRLLSYAADQAVHVTVEGNNTTTHIDRVTAAKGVLKLQNAEAHEITYVVHNAAADTRTVVLEQPVVRGFTLDSTLPGNANPKPDETTPTVYRFRMTVAPGDTVRLHTGAMRRGVSTYQLSRSDETQLAFIFKQANDNAALVHALQPILEARRHVSEAQTAVDQTNTRLTALRTDEDRQRANITALASADRGSRDRFVKDLNTTEDQIKSAQTELATRTTALDAAKADLVNKIEALQIDQSI
jgi:hypothetical protein